MATSRLTIGTKYHLAIFFAEAVIFTLLFFVFEGYQFGVGNQLVFLPVIDSLSKYPHLANDFGVSLCRFYHPFFNISMAWLSGFISLPLLFLLMQTLLVLIFHITLRRITLFFFDSPIIYWSVVILMFLWTQQGVDGNVLWTNRLEAQYLAWP